jgi:16S rRNA (cytosine967-C5)-methyltransferase
VVEAENGGQIGAFLARHPGFAVIPPDQVAQVLGERAFLFRRAVWMTSLGLLMTPRRTDTDGFFVAGLRRQ